MMLTTKARYAVMAVLDMVLHTQGKPIKLADIAKRQNIDPRYLEQIFLKLKNENIVRSVRGPGGGYLLSAANYQKTSIYSIVAAVEENIELTRCKNSGIGCMQASEKCISHHLWGGLTSQIKNYLSNISIHDVINQHQRQNTV